MKLNRFCAKCGTRVEKFVPGTFFCEACAGILQEPSDLSISFLLRKCHMCGAYSLKINDHLSPWEYRGEDEPDIDFLTRVIFEHKLFSIEKKEEKRFSLFFDEHMVLTQTEDIKFILQTKEGIYKSQQECLIKAREVHCDHCARKMGGRFDAVLQIRIHPNTDKAMLQELLDEVTLLEREVNFKTPASFIAKREEVNNGFDLYMSTNSFLRVMSNRLKSRHAFQLKRSKKLMGRDGETGGDLYRQYVLLRLVPVTAGMFVEIEGTRHRVQRLSKNKVIMQEVGSNKQQHVNFDIFEKKRWRIPANPDQD